jgi:hypothetical protein
MNMPDVIMVYAVYRGFIVFYRMFSTVKMVICQN